MMSTKRQHVEQLIGQLAPDQLEAVAHLLEVMLDPVARSIADAPFEDDEISAETAAELDAAHASIARGEGVPHEEIMRQHPAVEEDRRLGRQLASAARRHLSRDRDAHSPRR